MRKCVKRHLLRKTIAKNFVLRCVFRISDEEWYKGKTRLSCMEWGWCGLWLPSRNSLGLIRPDYNRQETKHCWYLWVHDICLRWESREVRVDTDWMRHTDLNFETTHLWMNVFGNPKKKKIFFTPLDYQMGAEGGMGLWYLWILNKWW